MQSDNATPSDLLACIRQACDKLECVPDIADAAQQIEHVLGDGWHKQLGPFDDWFRDQVVPVLTAYERKKGKDMANAQYQKELADMYMAMVDLTFQEKAMKCLSQVSYSHSKAYINSLHSSSPLGDHLRALFGDKLSARVFHGTIGSASSGQELRGCTCRHRARLEIQCILTFGDSAQSDSPQTFGKKH